MIDEQLRVHTEQLIKAVAAIGPRLEGKPGKLSHGENTPVGQLFCDSRAHPPEIRQGLVIPQLPAIAHFVQVRHPHPVLVRGDVLGHNVHCHLAQVQVGSHPCRGGNACGIDDFQNQLFCQASGIHMVELQVGGGIDKHLVDGVDMNVLRRYILEINLIDVAAVLHIVCHSGRGHDVIQLLFRVAFQLHIVTGAAIKGFSRRPLLPQRIDLTHPLDHFKESGPAGYAVGLQRRCHRQADGFFGPAGIRHHQIGGQRVQFPLHTLYGSVKGFEINGDILPVHTGSTSFPNGFLPLL